MAPKKDKPKLKLVKEAEPKRKQGRPNIEVTEQQRAQAKLMLSVGVGIRECSAYLGMAINTFRKKFKKEISFAQIEVNSNVAGALYRNAMAGNVTAQIFWCKTRLGWREVDRTEVETEPVQIIFQDGQTPERDRNAINDG